MAILKCTMCGGELDVNSDVTVGVCQYCGSKITIPKELDTKGKLYNRANYLRQNNEFDRAISVYEDILKEDNEDAEAHYGLFLSKYGIEYVEDPKTRELKPTCHRLQYISVFADSDYRAAIQYADPLSREIYQTEVQKISVIVNRIVELAAREEPYDIFICYKESDDLGERTEDSRIAQDLYQRLEKRGYKTFYARKTLESKLGGEYEPIIFSALNSAKIMIVLGTKANHFQGVWVRNEWSRFLELIREDTEKLLIPAYKGISAYELPDELSMFQAQDMGKLGFMEDLLEGISKVMKKNKQPEYYDNNVDFDISSGANVISIERELKKAETILNLGEKSKATDIFERLIEEFPDDYRSWHGMYNLKKNSILDTKKFIDNLKYINYAIKVCDSNKQDELKNEKNDDITKFLNNFEHQISHTTDMKLKEYEDDCRLVLENFDEYSDSWWCKLRFDTKNFTYVEIDEEKEKTVKEIMDKYLSLSIQDDNKNDRILMFESYIKSIYYYRWEIYPERLHLEKEKEDKEKSLVEYTDILEDSNYYSNERKMLEDEIRGIKVNIDNNNKKLSKMPKKQSALAKFFSDDSERIVCEHQITELSEKLRKKEKELKNIDGHKKFAELQIPILENEIRNIKIKLNEIAMMFGVDEQDTVTECNKSEEIAIPRYCTICGAKVSKDVVMDSSVSVYCDECGALIN